MFFNVQAHVDKLGRAARVMLHSKHAAHGLPTYRPAAHTTMLHTQRCFTSPTAYMMPTSLTVCPHAATAAITLLPPPGAMVVNTTAGELGLAQPAMAPQKGVCSFVNGLTDFDFDLLCAVLRPCHVPSVCGTPLCTDGIDVADGFRCVIQLAVVKVTAEDMEPRDKGPDTRIITCR